VAVRDGSGRWDLGGAADVQRLLRARVEPRDRLGPVRIAAGADVSYDRSDPTMYAAVVLVDRATLEPIETSWVVRRAEFPYLPGYLSFREAPAVVEAFRRLERRPDVLLVDGHGVAHPRGFGLACHLGVLLDVPTIGVAKSILVGAAPTPGSRRGSSAPLVYRGRQVGSAVRTRPGVRPVYVSVGHRVSLRTAIRLAVSLTGRYRIAEPIRRAHLAVNALRAGRGRPGSER
jgi:deoxyribonuclease V